MRQNGPLLHATLLWFLDLMLLPLVPSGPYLNAYFDNHMPFSPANMLILTITLPFMPTGPCPLRGLQWAAPAFQSSQPSFSHNTLPFMPTGPCLLRSLQWAAPAFWPPQPSFPMSLCLSCLQDHVFSEAYSGQRLPFSPVKFLDTWWRSAEGSLAGYQQQDAHEFYLSLLDGLSQPTERSTTPSLSGSLSPAPTSKSATPPGEGAEPYI